ncbi:MAG TPA: LysM peptidoglycan-binding domain-containing protein [Candidatus Udaeobacter sp.]|nr:LysM peptidoglycan-binding domain-containing protein [Candidatus Udaeobacter sp.]
MISARDAYQAAWAQRQSGDFKSAINTSNHALSAIAEALATGPDASERMNLVDLDSKLRGLVAASRRDSASASSAAAAGNPVDEKVLSAPAAEEIKPQFNADVYRYIDFFTGAGRSQFERWLKRSGRYMELFRDVLHKEGLPPDLVHLVFVESGFNINARSVSAAVGPWQLLRGTARMFGLNVNKWVDERKDPEKSSVAAARYLKHLYAVFGDWPLALASYNAGEGTVLRAIRTQGTTNYWDLKLPRQTEDYVPQFMAVLAIAHDPKHYGFDSVELDDPMSFDQIAFKGAVNLRSIAKLAGCSYEDLKLLNPAVLTGHATGPNGVTTLRVPPGQGEELMKKLHGGATLPAANLTLQHKVKHGETLRTIAAQYSVSARRLALANGIGRRRPLKLGQVLTVPASLSSPAPIILDGSDPRTSTAYVPERDFRPLVRISGRSTADGRSKWTVRRGQTLAIIADSTHVAVDDLKRWNGLTNNMLKPGQRLKIRSDSTEATLSPADSAQVARLHLPAHRHRHGRHHRRGYASTGMVTVRQGDTLNSIANRHGVSVLQLKRANGLRSTQVRAGQRLRIPNG